MKTTAATAGALSHLRVVELGEGVALAYAGKLFADFGAQVVKLEAPGGDPLRRQPPLVDSGQGMQSALFAWLNTNKLSVTGLDGIDACDVLLDARPRGDDPAATPPATVSVRISWFGDSGPYRDFASTDGICRALAGTIAGTGPAEGPPSMLGGIGAEVVGGIGAFNAAASALWSRSPRRYELSIHEANIAIAEYQVAEGAANPLVEKRQGVNRFAPTFPLGIYPCREGWLGIMVQTPEQFRVFCDMLGIPGVARDPRFVVGTDRLLHAAELEGIFGPLLLQRTAHDWFERALALRLPFAVVPDMATLLATPSHRLRDAFASVRIGDAVFEGPTLPQRLVATPPLAAGVAPMPGQHDGMHFAPRPPRRPLAASGLPLQGLRVIDFSMGWAGPLCSRQLADLGADVVKVEACQYPDWWRGVDPRASFFESRQYEKSPRFGVMNRNKLGITVDLTSPDGVALLKRLVAEADAVVENYAADVLPKLGLDYPALSTLRPDLVMVSMPAFGGSGPWRDARAYGSTLEWASGLPTMSGEPDWPPTMNHMAHGDPIGGLNATAAVLVALLHQRETGEGQHIDLAQVECMFPLVAPWMLAHSATGSAGPRWGNRHPEQVPHGVFPTERDGWLALAVTDDAAWRGLCIAMERGDLLADATLSSAAGRRAREAELDAAVSAWTSLQDADAAMCRLQANGVAAGVVRIPSQLVDDPHLTARGFWRTAERAWLPPQAQSALPFREVGTEPYPLRRPAPTLGEHNALVLGGRLGLTADELDRLARAGITGTEAVPATQRRPRQAKV